MFENLKQLFANSNWKNWNDSLKFQLFVSNIWKFETIKKEIYDFITVYFGFLFFGDNSASVAAAHLKVIAEIYQDSNYFPDIKVLLFFLILANNTFWIFAQKHFQNRKMYFHCQQLHQMVEWSKGRVVQKPIGQEAEWPRGRAAERPNGRRADRTAKRPFGHLAIQLTTHTGKRPFPKSIASARQLRMRSSSWPFLLLRKQSMWYMLVWQEVIGRG